MYDQLETNTSVIDESPATNVTDRPIVVLLVDDQPLIGCTIRDMLLAERDIELHLCHDPREALTLAAGLMPSVVLLDLCMPHMDGLELLKRLRSDPETSEVPIIVLSSRTDPTIKARALGLRASDYLVKIPNRIELIARIRHHASEHTARLYKRLAYTDITAGEVAQAERYISSLIPSPMKDARVRVDWRLVPSARLGGDAIGFQWLDSDRLAVYMLDVSGHGVGASLLAVTVLTILRHQTLPKTDFFDPADVLHSLNSIFRMDRHGQRYFTIWYGIYDVRDKTLTYSVGGHPPPLLFGGANATKAELTVLRSCGAPIGITDDSNFMNERLYMPTGARLLLYSDGAVDIQDLEGQFADHDSFTQFVSNLGPADDLLDQILDRAKQLHGSSGLADDCTLIQVDFG